MQRDSHPVTLPCHTRHQQPWFDSHIPLDSGRYFSFFGGSLALMSKANTPHPANSTHNCVVTQQWQGQLCSNIAGPEEKVKCTHKIINWSLLEWYPNKGQTNINSSKSQQLLVLPGMRYTFLVFSTLSQCVNFEKAQCIIWKTQRKYESCEPCCQAAMVLLSFPVTRRLSERGTVPEGKANTEKMFLKNDNCRAKAQADTHVYSISIWKGIHLI